MSKAMWAKRKLLIELSFCLIFLMGCSKQIDDSDISDKSSSKATGMTDNQQLQEFANWEEAYRYILCHIRSYMGDPYGLYGNWESEIFDMVDAVLRIGIHDFNGDGIPELILGAETSMVYSYSNGKIVKVEEISLPKDKYRLDGFFVDEDTFLAVVEVTWETEYTVFTACRFESGQYVTCLCDKNYPQNTTINGQSATNEECYQMFPIIQRYLNGELSAEKNAEKFWINSEAKTLRTAEIVNEYADIFELRNEGAIPIDEKFDLNMFEW